MKQETKEQIVFWAMIIIKILTTLRTGIDTYLVSQDILNVILIDAIFMVLWLVLAYGGKGQAAMVIRPFAGIFAAILYGWMVVIGWEAHNDQIVVSLAARTAGLMMLLYDGWDYVVSLWQRKEDLLDTSVENSRKVRKVIRTLSEEYLVKEAQADSETRLQRLAVSVRLKNHMTQLSATLQETASTAVSEAQIKQIPSVVNSVNSVNFTPVTPASILPEVRMVLDVPSEDLDIVDKRLIQLYQDHPGASYRTMANMLGQSHTAVSNRVKKLERFGLLEKKSGKVYSVESSEIFTEVVEGELADQSNDDPQGF